MTKVSLSEPPTAASNSTQNPLKWSDLQAVFAVNEDSDSTGAIQPFCFNCREDGHTDAHCPSPRRCYVCLKATHQGYQCTENPVIGSVVFKPGARCDYCHEKGHTALFCRRPGGSAQGRKADTVYPRPLVLHAPREGPSEAEVKYARAQIVEVLKRLTAGPNSGVAAVMRLDLSKTRDSEFFCAVLPLLNDPSASLTTEDRNCVRQSLFKMRGAVAGGIQLGVSSGGGVDGRRAKSTVASSAEMHHVNDDRDLLYDMKTSGLDINVLHGGKLDVFHRTRASRGGEGLTALSSDAETNREDLLHPERVISDTMYLSSLHRAKGVKGGGGTAHDKNSTSDAKQGPLSGAPIAKPVDRLTANLEQLSMRKNLIASAPARRSQPQAHIMISPTRATHARRLHVGGAASSTASNDASSTTEGSASPSSRRFIAPVPPHMRQKGRVAEQVLHDWVGGPSSHTPSAGGSPRGAPESPRGGSVRAFLKNATHQFGNPQKRWSVSHQSSGPSCIRDASDSPIMNWERYRKQHPTSRHGDDSSTSAQRKPSETSKQGSARDVPVRPDLVTQWRESFDHSKAKNAEAVERMLAERAVHRRIVSGDVTRYEGLATSLVQRAVATSASPRTSVAVMPVPLGEGSDLKANLWTVHCGVLANDEAEETLRQAVVTEMYAYAERIAFAQDAYERYKNAPQTFLNSLERLTHRAESQEEFKGEADKLVKSFADKFQSGKALLSRLTGVAATLFYEMQVAQIQPRR